MLVRPRTNFVYLFILLPPSMPEPNLIKPWGGRNRSAFVSKKSSRKYARDFPKMTSRFSDIENEDENKIVQYAIFARDLSGRRDRPTE
jgi:hypothetical protein